MWRCRRRYNLFLHLLVMSLWLISSLFLLLGSLPTVHHPTLTLHHNQEPQVLESNEILAKKDGEEFGKYTRKMNSSKNPIQEEEIMKEENTEVIKGSSHSSMTHGSAYKNNGSGSMSLVSNNKRELNGQSKTTTAFGVVENYRLQESSFSDSQKRNGSHSQKRNNSQISSNSKLITDNGEEAIVRGSQGGTNSQIYSGGKQTGDINSETAGKESVDNPERVDPNISSSVILEAGQGGLRDGTNVKSGLSQSKTNININIFATESSTDSSGLTGDVTNITGEGEVVTQKTVNASDIKLSHGMDQSEVSLSQEEIEDIRAKQRKVNEQQEILNLHLYGPITHNTTIILIQVHKRLSNLQYLVASLLSVRGVNQSLVIFSHDFWSQEINHFIRGIVGFRVMQFFFPHSLQLHPNQFPGPSKGDCAWNNTRRGGERCTGDSDSYGHYREAPFTQIKHHWWWKINRVFKGMWMFPGRGSADENVSEGRQQPQTKDTSKTILSRLKNSNNPTRAKREAKDQNEKEDGESRDRNLEKDSASHESKLSKIGVKTERGSITPGDRSKIRGGTNQTKTNITVGKRWKYSNEELNATTKTNQHKDIDVTKEAHDEDGNGRREGVGRWWSGWVLFLEEDHYLSPDALHVLASMISLRPTFCPHCHVLVLGNYNKAPAATFSDKVVVRTWPVSQHNMGYALDRTAWSAISRCAHLFCNYDDYNWDWSLARLVSTCVEPKLKMMALMMTRAMHVGSCGTHIKKSSCNTTLEVEAASHYYQTAANFLFPSTLYLHRKSSTKANVPKPNGGWGDRRDHALCLAMAEERGEEKRKQSLQQLSDLISETKQNKEGLLWLAVRLVQAFSDQDVDNLLRWSSLRS
ncbi:hypothetical protein Pmani_024241 [Petrolisthes manimaculis]|uniref:Alpha-1,6-mannosyl-glycoprotein 2-beta-N-acetylglucosaminyltransferase n=1 Tax=Petrolisthes manimaculis TaxID=1843537 RepID=A0AAE1U2J6_9EUCA|nr:hypothetical protein Pmani_024241 [Petrolisthes manimaculis]